MRFTSLTSALGRGEEQVYDLFLTYVDHTAGVFNRFG